MGLISGTGRQSIALTLKWDAEQTMSTHKRPDSVLLRRGLSDIGLVWPVPVASRSPSCDYPALHNGTAVPTQCGTAEEN